MKRNNGIVVAKHYIVVENSGYVGERDVFETTSYDKAITYINMAYCPEEVDDFHVQVCREVDGQRSYEI